MSVIFFRQRKGLVLGFYEPDKKDDEPVLTHTTASFKERRAESLSDLMQM